MSAIQAICHRVEIDVTVRTEDLGTALALAFSTSAPSALRAIEGVVLFTDLTAALGVLEDGYHPWCAMTCAGDETNEAYGRSAARSVISWFEGMSPAGQFAACVDCPDAVELDVDALGWQVQLVYEAVLADKQHYMLYVRPVWFGS